MSTPKRAKMQRHPHPICQNCRFWTPFARGILEMMGDGTALVVEHHGPQKCLRKSRGERIVITAAAYGCGWHKESR